MASKSVEVVSFRVNTNPARLITNENTTFTFPFKLPIIHWILFKTGQW